MTYSTMLLCHSAVATVLLVVAASVSLHLDVHHQQQLDDLWQSFKKTYNKVYDVDEDAFRRKVWAANVEYIQIHNIEADLGRHSYTLGVNEYSDLTKAEYRKMLLGLRSPGPPRNGSNNDVHYFKSDASTLPKTVDWRKHGYVTPIKNQGGCGSCWAFSSTGSLEGQNFKKTGQLVSLSEQNLVDCTRSLGNEGCDGGWMNVSFIYVEQNGGIDTESSYPYEGRDGQCRFKSSTIGGKCTGHKSVSPAGDEQALQAAVASIGPISVAIDAMHDSFMSYKSGVYDEPDCTDEVDHAVLVVGYGTYQGKDYWLVKNSWGTTWGMQGYIMMSRNKQNQCAIASYAIYPTV